MINVGRSSTNQIQNDPQKLQAAYQSFWANYIGAMRSAYQPSINKKDQSKLPDSNQFCPGKIEPPEQPPRIDTENNQSSPEIPVQTKSKDETSGTNFIPDAVEETLNNRPQLQPATSKPKTQEVKTENFVNKWQHGNSRNFFYNHQPVYQDCLINRSSLDKSEDSQTELYRLTIGMMMSTLLLCGLIVGIIYVSNNFQIPEGTWTWIFFSLCVCFLIIEMWGFQIQELTFDTLFVAKQFFNYLATPSNKRNLAKVNFHRTKELKQFSEALVYQLSSEKLSVRRDFKLDTPAKQNFAENFANSQHLRENNNDNPHELIYVKSRSLEQNEQFPHDKLMVKALIQDTLPANCQLDSGSQISLVSSSFYQSLKNESDFKFQEITNQPLVIRGIGSKLKHDTPCVLIKIQLGKVQFVHKFLVTPYLENTDFLLGLDLIKQKKLFVKPGRGGELTLTIGDFDCPLTTVRLKNSLDLYQIMCNEDMSFRGQECKKISIEILPRKTKFTQLASSDHIQICNHEFNKQSPVQIDPDSFTPAEKGKFTFILENRSTLPTEIPAGWLIGNLQAPRAHRFKEVNQLQGENRPISYCVRFLEEMNDSIEFTQLNPENEELLSDDICESKIGFEFIKKENLFDQELEKLKLNEQIPERFRQELIDFIKEETPSLISQNEFDIGKTDRIKHQVILNDVTPINLKPYKCSGIRLSQLKAAILDLEKAGLIKQGDSDFTAPCYLVGKSPEANCTAGRQRLVVNFRSLNRVTRKSNFPMLDIPTLMTQMSNYRLFSALDIRAGFNTIEIDEESRRFVCLCTPWAVYECIRLPFGLTTGPSTFIRLITMLFENIPFVIYYMDDLLVCANTEKEMIENLKLTFKILTQNGLKIVPSKASYFKKQIKWLGMVMSHLGKSPDPKKIQKIRSLPLPKSVKELQAYLGYLAYQCAFIPSYSQLTAPLSELLKGKVFQMTREAEEAFHKINNLLARDLMLYHPRYDHDAILQSDASATAVGGVLYQSFKYQKTPEGYQKMKDDWDLEGEITSCPSFITPPACDPAIKNPNPAPFELHNGQPEIPRPDYQDRKTLKENFIYLFRPIGFVSKKLNDCQRISWSIHEKELYSLLTMLFCFEDYLYAFKMSGKKTYAVIDNQIVIYSLKFKDGPNAKISRWVACVLSFPFDLIISYSNTAKMNVADFLSRLYSVEDQDDSVHPKKALVISTIFHPCEILSWEKAINLFLQHPECVQQAEEEKVSQVNMLQLKKSNELNRIEEQVFNGYVEGKEILIEPESYMLESSKFVLQHNELQEHLSPVNLALHQKLDPVLNPIIEVLEKGGKVKEFYLYKNLLKLPNKLGLKEQMGRIVIPPYYRAAVLALFHLHSHSGAKKLTSEIGQFYFWPNMREDIENFTAGCVLCAEQKHHNHRKSELGSLKNYSFLDCWTIDIVEGLRPSFGKTAFLNCLECYTNFVVSFPITNKESPQIGELIEKSIFHVFGPPKFLLCDNALSFDNSHIRKMFDFYGTKLKLSTRYRPQSHGTIEVANKNIQTLMRIFEDQYGKSWSEVLTLSAKVMNMCPRPELDNLSPYQLMFGKQPNWHEISFNSPDDYIDPKQQLIKIEETRKLAQSAINKLHKLRKKRNDRQKGSFVPFPVGNLVYIKDNRTLAKKKTLARYFVSPSVVLADLGNTVIHQNILGQIKRDHKSNLKFCHERTRELFDDLPTEVKVKLGGVFTKEDFRQFLELNEIPEFIKNRDTILSELNDGNIADRTRNKLKNQASKPQSEFESEEEFIKDGFDGSAMFLPSDLFAFDDEDDLNTLLTPNNEQINDLPPILEEKMMPKSILKAPSTTEANKESNEKRVSFET